LENGLKIKASGVNLDLEGAHSISLVNQRRYDVTEKKAKKAVKRPTVTGITLNISYPDGTSKTITVDAWRIEGIFWSDRSVLEMLAPFYDKVERITTVEELEDRFGTNRLKSIKTSTGDVKITPKLIETLWNTPGDHGHLLPVIMKTRKCIPTPGSDI
jgi:hypothetical protein